MDKPKSNTSFSLLNLIGKSKNKGIKENIDLHYVRDMIFGCFNNGKEKLIIRSDKPLTTLILTPKGTQKTAKFAIPNLLSLPQSCVVLDIEGELYAKTASRREEKLNNKILLFSPLSNENTMFFNPFDNKVVKNMNLSQYTKLVTHIADAIFVDTDSTESSPEAEGIENKHWILSAKTMFKFFALYSLVKHHHTTLPDLAQAPTKDYYDELKGEYLKMCQIKNEQTGELERNIREDALKVFFLQTANDKSLSDSLTHQARRYLTATESEFAQIKSTYESFMAVFNNPQIAEALSSMSFYYEDLRKEYITMYITLHNKDLDMLAPLVRILLETLCENLMAEKIQNPDKFIYLILDDFVRFGKMPFLLEMPALCGDCGIAPVYIAQSYEQIKECYGQNGLDIICAHWHIKLYLE